jgi:hypothetical protein
MRGTPVTAETFTFTTHVVEVDLTERLAAFSSADEVVVVLRTPNGRGKRVRIPAHLLVSQEDPFA